MNGNDTGKGEGLHQTGESVLKRNWKGVKSGGGEQKTYWSRKGIQLEKSP